MVQLALFQVVLTLGFSLANQWVIHTVAVSFMDNPDAELVLALAIDSALKLATKHDIKSLAMPAIGTGVFRCPPGLSADYTARALAWHSRNGSPLERVRICITNASLQDIFEQAVEQAFA